MASGRVQLASSGIQDEPLTGEPQITYFLKKFNRHTHFAIETSDNGVDGNIAFGGRVRCRIGKRGDLIRSIYLRLELSELSNAAAPYNVGYTDSICSSIIEYADLIIGGQTVHRLTGEFMEIYSEFFVRNSQQLALKILTGKTGVREGLGPASADPLITDAYDGAYPRTFLIALPFYFCGADGLSIPLSAIDRHEVEVEIKLRPLSSLVVQPHGSTYVDAASITGQINKLSMPVEYVYLTDDENRYIRSKSIDYVITQLQLSTFVIEPDTTDMTMLINFVNPVKELFLVIQDQSAVESNTATGNDWFNYKNKNNKIFPKFEQLSSLSLLFNNEERVADDVATSLYLRYLHPIQFHTRCAVRNIYNYSFSLDPENHVPTGQVNMSRILNKILKIKTTHSNKKRIARLYAISYNVLRINAGISGVLFADTNLT